MCIYKVVSSHYLSHIIYANRWTIAQLTGSRRTGAARRMTGTPRQKKRFLWPAQGSTAVLQGQTWNNMENHRQTLGNP